MTIGKRKGYTVKGSGAPGSAVGNEKGGSLSKNDHWYLQQAFGMAVDPGIAPIPAIEATGGLISDYSTPTGDVYRAHVFTGTSTFNVSNVASDPTFNTVEYMVVAGGGGGGAGFGGAGGAGGLRTNLSGNPYSTSVAYPIPAAANYPVVVGAGGARGRNQSAGSDGGNSSFGSPTQGIITSNGGGFGGGNPYNKDAGPGGSGGSAGMSGGAGTPGTTIAVTTPSPWPGPSVQGYAGGATYDPGGFGTNNSGGGGGAGSAGGGGHPTAGAGGNGGDGIQVLIGGPPTGVQSIGGPGPSPLNGYFAGGGGGSSGSEPYRTVGKAGGGHGGVNSQPSPGSPGTWGGPALAGTGSGGGGSGGASTPTSRGGSGGSGIVVVRYKLGAIGGTAKATGGTVSFSPSGKTVHTFTSSGTFVMPGSYPSTPVQILTVAGGGGGGNRHGGGGGAGGVVQLPAANGTIANGTYSVVIGAGGQASTMSQPSDQGSDTSFGPPASASAPTHLLAKGGGVGGQYPGSTGESAGGSGGGASGEPGSGASGTQPAPSVYGTSTGHGNPGGAGANWGSDDRLGGGGGGAGGAGADGGPGAPATANGGVGLQVQIAGDPNNNYYWAGGGGGGAWSDPKAGDGGKGGGGGGSTNGGAPLIGIGGIDGVNEGYDGTPGTVNIGGDGGTNTGGGGGGNGQSNYGSWPVYARGGSGGSGICIIAYPT